MSEVKTVETTGGDVQELVPRGDFHPNQDFRLLATKLCELAGYLVKPPDWYDKVINRQCATPVRWESRLIRPPIGELDYQRAFVALWCFRAYARLCVAHVKERLSDVEALAVNLPADMVDSVNRMRHLGDTLLKRLEEIDRFATKWRRQILRINTYSWDAEKDALLAEAATLLAKPPYELVVAYDELRREISVCEDEAFPFPEATSQAADSETADATKELDNGKKPVASKTQTRGKRRKGRQQWTDAELKIIAFITQHHNYASDCPLNMTPIGVRELARQLGVSESTVSGFFKKQFGCYEAYERMCKSGNQQVLLASLKVLNGEFTPRILVEKPNEIAQPARPNDDEQSDVDANL